MINYFKNNKKHILIMIIVVQVIFISVMFGINKKGFHSDEMWNYGIANSTDGKNLYIDGEKDKNVLEWVDSKVMFDYITVDKSEIFSYIDIYKNASEDLNPPLQCMLLHFVCSLFLNKWSMWFGFIVNMIAFILTQIYLFKLIYSTTQNYYIAFLSVVLFGFSNGILNIASFLRLYGLGVAFVIMFLYYSNEVFLNKDNKKMYTNNIIKSAIVCALGALTVNLFYVVAFIITLMYSLYYLFSKRIALFFKNGLTIMVSVILAILAFPYAFMQMLAYRNGNVGKMYPPLWQFRIYWSFITKDISGVHISAFKTMFWNYVFVGIIIFLFFFLPISFLLRKNERFRLFIKKCKDKIVKLIKTDLKKIPYVMIVSFVSVFLFLLFNAYNTSIYEMGLTSKRYIFLVYPLYTVFFSILIYYVTVFFLGNKIWGKLITFILVTVMVVLTYCYGKNPFFFKRISSGKTFEQIEDDADVIMVLSARWLVTASASDLYHTNRYYLTDYYNYIQDNYSDGIDDDRPLYLLLDVSILTDQSELSYETDDLTIIYSSKNAGLLEIKDTILDYYKELDITTDFEMIGVDSIFDRSIEIYRLK